MDVSEPVATASPGTVNFPQVARSRRRTHLPVVRELPALKTEPAVYRLTHSAAAMYRG